MDATTETLVRAEDLEGLGITEPCELVRGRIVYMTPAGMEHGLVASRLNKRLVAYLLEHDLGEVIVADTGFQVERDPDTVRAPDLAFLSHESLARSEEKGGTYVPQSPDLAIEVLSPSNTWEKVQDKVSEYLAAGSRLVWLLDPARRTVHIYRPGPAGHILGPADTLDGGDVLPGFEVPVADLFVSHSSG